MGQDLDPLRTIATLLREAERSVLVPASMDCVISRPCLQGLGSEYGVQRISLHDYMFHSR